MQQSSLTFIESPEDFPNIHSALKDPDGLLAFGNHLSTELVLAAYNKGIFPWFDDEQPVLWWSPSTRAILFPQNIRIRKSLKQSIKNKGYTITINTCFHDVIDFCSTINRKHQQQTWITTEMIAVYSELHALGKAHSIEAWHHGNLVGGLYGVFANGVFCGESMFSIKTDASKICLVALVQHAKALGISIIDCQIMSPHLRSLGATELTREKFVSLFDYSRTKMHPPSSKKLDIAL